MIRIYLSAVLACLTFSTFGQLNMNLLSNLEYDQSLSDIWGYADPDDGTEYALVGLRNGTSIVSLADPTNATELHYIPGPSSTWRDLKTYGEYAYVSNETSNGVLVIDMRMLPDSITYYEWQPNLPELGGTLSTIHNLYVDEQVGQLYITGSNLNSGGVIIADVGTDPYNPVVIGNTPAIYAHDVYVRDNISYNSEIYLGEMTAYDISDPTEPVRLGSTPTPFAFTHNVWLSDDGNTAFTTDERANAPVAAYDISDLSDIVELDQYRPLGSVGSGVIPHNVHVWNDYLIISYYTDGGRIVDASRPDNLIEVGNFDTWFGGDGGFSGAWGAYPFLPSGNVILSDISNGLYVLGTDYVRAAYLEGTITDAQSGATLEGATVDILSDELNESSSNIFGEYKTGLAVPGTFDVVYARPGYVSQTISTTFENGVLNLQDVALEPLATFAISGTTIDTETGERVGNVQVVLSGETLDYEATSNDDGEFEVAVIASNYDVFAGVWGYRTTTLPGTPINGDQELVISLDRGYRDEFVLDLGWETDFDVNDPTDDFTGGWERAIPIGTNFQGSVSAPGNDVATDLGDYAYVTDNGGGGAGDFDIDNGVAILTSPPMNLSWYADPVITYQPWFFNAGGSGTPNDRMQVFLLNGSEEVLVETINNSASIWQLEREIRVADFIAPEDGVRLRFAIGDFTPGHLVEGGVDNFEVLGEFSVATTEVAPEVLGVVTLPNPFADVFTLNYQIPSDQRNAQVTVFNALGQQVLHRPLPTGEQQLQLGREWVPGLYFVQLTTDALRTRALRVVKH